MEFGNISYCITIYKHLNFVLDNNSQSFAYIIKGTYK